MERVTDYLLPVRVVKSENAIDAEWLLKCADEQIYIMAHGGCTIKSGGYVILDFGKELHGGIRILNSICDDNSGKQNIRIRFGESVAETCSDIGVVNATNDHSPRDMKVCIPMLSDLEFGQTGFRFVRIDNLSTYEYKLVSVRAAYKHLKVTPKGYFKCDDKLVNEIYDTAAHTLFLCMQNRLWDGIKRDRLVWLGDMHPEVRGILSLYGEHPLIELGLSESTLYNPLPGWMSSAPSYSIWWLNILCDYEWNTDKWDFIKTQLEYAYGVLEQIDRCVDDNGNIDYLAIGLPTGYGFFLNWETRYEEGLESGNRGLLLCTLNKFISMASRRSVQYDTAFKIVNKLNKKQIFEGKSKSVAALYSMGYGVNEDARKILLSGGAKGFSTFMSSYIADAIAECHSGELALKDMKDFYSGMLSRGATSFWESYDPDWLIGSGRIDKMPEKNEKDIHSSFGDHCYVGFRLSLCHGWACGPVPFLSERALGVKFKSAGGSLVEIKPDLMGLKKVEGAYPTPYGLIEVIHKQTESGVESKIKLPSGVTRLCK